MANLRTQYTPIAAAFRSLSNFHAGQAGQLVPVKIVIDTPSTRIGIWQPEKGSFAAILGCQYAKQGGHTLTFELGDIDTTDSSFATVANPDTYAVFDSNTGFGFSKEISSRPMLIGTPSKGLCVTSSIALTILFYVSEFQNFRF